MYVPLLESDVDPDPFVQFGRWLDDAVAAGIPEPTAMTLATATRDGRPSARVVLLKGFDPQGFVFYTNRQSRKGCELAENPRAALVFLWKELGRQVRIEGAVELTTDAESDAYFASRPLGSRIGAIASRQSGVLPDRETLERRVEALTGELSGREPPRPPHWGGYRVVAHELEFWQHQPNRLHDRVRYRREGDRWVLERLSP
ncbi:MAG: pyridoxamine 5'-phosphate oxidase [Chloroflexota bacterium]|nr:pyridoxamine 5'-phosphate oxidase [Chloroflexota bacterium]